MIRRIWPEPTFLKYPISNLFWTKVGNPSSRPCLYWSSIALRLYPQPPVNIRVTMKTTLVPDGGGPDRFSPVLIRRGTGIDYSVYHMHRRKDLYGNDAAEFRPERWEENDLANTIGWGFSPFHGGPRICLGSEPCFLSFSLFLCWLLLLQRILHWWEPPTQSSASFRPFQTWGCHLIIHKNQQV